MTIIDLQKKLDELLRLPSETEWVEFKHNNDKPEEIGEYISALSNGAALHGKEVGYLKRIGKGRSILYVRTDRHQQ